jgi:iron complex transport system substrate-binding protein
MSKFRLAALGALVALGALGVFAGCGASSTTPSTRASGHGRYPVTVVAANGGVTVPHRPRRIVSLSASATEDLFAIGAGSEVIAVDDQSNYPRCDDRNHRDAGVAGRIGDPVNG